MKLSDRLKLSGAASAPPPPANGSSSATTAPQMDAAHDPLLHMKQRAQKALFLRLGSRLYDSSLSETQLQEFVTQELSSIIESERAPLTPGERQRLVREISNDVIGYGPLEAFLADPTVTEVMVNGGEFIYVERAGKIQRTDARFLSDEHLRRVIEKIVSQVGRRIDESSPMVDARLPDGSRVNAIIPPLAVNGPAMTIRKFSIRPFYAEDLVRMGTLTAETVQLLEAAVKGRLNVLVSGGTGTGKTTMLNTLSGFIPDDERIVTIEDAVELRMMQEHVVSLESRPANIEGKGEITIRDLVRNALRMRPDRILVGEVRGGEALDMLQAMNTGHEGSLSTVHANSPRDCLARLETMVLMAGMDLPVRAIREQAASAVDLIVHLARLRDGTRRVTHVTEVQGMEGQVISMQDIHVFDFGAGVDTEGKYRGQLVATGIRPSFAERLANMGIDLPSDIFGASSHLRGA